MKFFRPLAMLTFCGIISGLFTGCAWSIGDGKGHSSVQATRGQELIDLKRAKDRGAISDSEYEAQKQQILAK
jgi:hypothetical protein